MSTNAPARITDSGWFWLGLFAMMGMFAILAIQPKFNRRQQRLELQQQVRQQVWQQRQTEKESANAANNSTTAPSASLEGGFDLEQAPAPVWPLVLGLAAVATFAGGMLWRQQSRSS